jgi:methanogenic corrinoid protein MtbC1
MSATGGQKTRDGRRIVIGGVAGDHGGQDASDFADRVRGEGFEVIDLGADVSAARFAGAVREHRPLAVVLTCHETICARAVGRVIEELDRQRLRDTVRVLARGAALDPEFAADAGADAFAADADAGAAIINGWTDS